MTTNMTPTTTTTTTMTTTITATTTTTTTTTTTMTTHEIFAQIVRRTLRRKTIRCDFYSSCLAQQYGNEPLIPGLQLDAVSPPFYSRRLKRKKR